MCPTNGSSRSFSLSLLHFSAKLDDVTKERLEEEAFRRKEAKGSVGMHAYYTRLPALLIRRADCADRDEGCDRPAGRRADYREARFAASRPVFY